MDLWSLGVGLFALGNFSSDNEVTDIILLGQTEELSDVVSSLWTQSLWNRVVGDTFNFFVTLLGDDQRQDSQIWANNGTSDGLSLSLTVTSWSVTGVTVSQQQLNSGWQQDTLLHWETLLVVTTGDLEDVALELVANGFTVNFLTNTLVVEDTDTVFIIDFDGLLSTINWVRNVQLKFYVSNQVMMSDPSGQING